MSGGLVSFVIATLAFHGSHVALSGTPLRGAVRDQLGERGFLILYVALSIVTFAWFVVAYVQAPIVGVWSPPSWGRFVPLAVMPLATILLIGGYTIRNPTAVGMERAAAADDPAPGIMRVTRHPIMWAIGLWALSHLAVAADAASLVFFGSMAALSLGGTVRIDMKKRLALGSNWARLAEVTSNVPFVALIAGRTRLRPAEIGILRIVAGVLLYLVLALAHPLFTGRLAVW